jgi:hypothetical protein
MEPYLSIVQTIARQPAWKVRHGWTGRIKRVLCPWYCIHDLCVDRHSARFEPRKKSQYTGARVGFKAETGMKHSRMAALPTRFWIGHMPWPRSACGSALDQPPGK